MWSFDVRDMLKRSPRNLVDWTQIISCPSISNVGVTLSSFLFDLNVLKVFFLMFRESLFKLNHHDSSSSKFMIEQI